MSARTRTLWTFAITSIALFMVSLDNLVVTTALPVIRTDLDASLADLEWTVNAYTLTFAVFLLTGAALGATAAATEPRVKTIRPIEKIRRLPNRSPSAAPVSRKTAKVSV